MMHYNWDLKATRIDYQEHCLPLVHPGIDQYPCSLYFTESLGIVFSSPQAGQDCCLAIPGIGAVPPNFLAPFNYTGSVDAYNMYGDVVACDAWVGPDAFGYRTAVADGADIVFKDGDSGVTWAVGDFEVTDQASSLFDLPSGGDCSKPCTFSQSAGPSPVLADPMVHLALLHSQYRK